MLFFSGELMSLTRNVFRRLEESARTEAAASFFGQNRAVDNLTGLQLLSFGGLAFRNRSSRGGDGLVSDDNGGGDAHLVANLVVKAGDRGLRPSASRAITADNVVRGSAVHGSQHASVTRILLVGNRISGSGIDGLETPGANHSALIGNRSSGNKGLDLRVTDLADNVFLDNKAKKTNLGA